MPKRLSKGKAVIVNNRIYFVGGATWTGGGSPVPSDSVYFANINSDGTIGNWTAATSLPTPLSGHGLIEANGKITTIGGSTDPGETPINKTYSAAINADGSLGNWIEGSSLPVAIRDGGMVKIGSYAIVAGGFSGQFSDKVYYSALDGNGNLGAWNQSNNNLPVTHCCGSLAVWYNRLYLSGGHDGANYLPAVYTVATTAASPPPSPSPTPTPTPLPSLTVPDIKQYSAPWNDDVYDQATGWSANPTIERWGCALTSAAMVLKYHGHNVNPDTLNNWLKSQTDGYIRNGLINWLAVSRYTRLNSSPSAPTLEYRRLGTNQADLITELKANRPAILAQPGHFVVGKSQTASSFGINDPAFANRTLLSDYGNTYQSLGSYRPTQTDLSYLMLAGDGDINLTVYDNAGNLVSGSSYSQEPLTDDIGGSATSGQTLKIYLYPTPATGNYTAKVSGAPGTYQIDSYLYNSTGDANTSTQYGILKSGEEDQINLVVGTSPSAKQTATIDSLISDLDSAQAQGLITKATAYRSLRNLFVAAKKLFAVGQNTAAKKLLQSAKTVISRFQFSQSAHLVLSTNIDVLLAN